MTSSEEKRQMRKAGIMTKPITAALFGARGRGFYSYGPYALEYPRELRFVAVAEPHAGRRERFAVAHEIPPERQFVTWEDLLARGRMADVLSNITQDQTHHLTGKAGKIEVPPTASGHGGGDFGIVRSFLRAVRGEEQPLTAARESLESHLMAFAAEESRLNATVVDMDEFRGRATGGA
jgi:predicted dehydrogenase